MLFSIGDLVFLKGSDRYGRIHRFLSDDRVELEIEGAFETMRLSALEVPYSALFSAQRGRQKPLGAPPQERDVLGAPKGFYLAFQPVFAFDGFDDVLTECRFHLANNSPYTLGVEIDLQRAGVSFFSLKETVNAYDHLFLKELSFSALQINTQIIFSLRQTADRQLEETMERTVQLRPKKLLDEADRLQRNKRLYAHLPIAKEFPSRTSGTALMAGFRREKRRPASPVQNLETRPEGRHEIDLHLEALAPGVKSLSGFEILQLQLAALEEAIDRALLSHQQSLVIIHGVGAGKLKSEVHSFLKGHPDVEFYVHDWMPKYGVGATEAFLRS